MRIEHIKRERTCLRLLSLQNHKEAREAPRSLIIGFFFRGCSQFTNVCLSGPCFYRSSLDRRNNPLQGIPQYILESESASASETVDRQPHHSKCRLRRVSCICICIKMDCMMHAYPAESLKRPWQLLLKHVVVSRTIP